MIEVSEQKKPMVVLICLVLIAASVIWMFARGCSRAPKADTRPGEALGTVLGEETIKLLGGKGQVVVVNMTPNNDPQAAQRPEAVALEKTLKKAGVTIIGKEQLDMNLEAMNVPADKMVQLINRYPKADVIISLIGFPVFRDSDLAALPEKPPKMVGIAWTTAGLKKLLLSQRLQFIIVPRRADRTGQSPKTTRDLFNLYFEIFTAANANKLPD